MSQGYTGVDNLEVMKGAKNYHAALIKLVTSSVPEGTKRLVDFGAGLGTYADSLQDEGFEVTCIENDPGLLAGLKSKGYQAYANLTDLHDCQVVYSLNVLEHIKEDEAVLGQLGQILAKGGRLVIYVPAFQSLFSSMDRKVGHHRRYRLKQLEAIVKRQGLEVETGCYVDSLGYLAALAFKLFGNSDGAINETGLKLYDTFILPLSLLLDRVTGRWFGKNVLVVAKRVAA